MKKKISIIGIVIVIITAVVVILNTPGTFYSTPEAALMNWDPDGKYNCKNIIDTAWMGEEPVIFYVTKEGNFCNGEFKKTEAFGETGWKVAVAGMLLSIDKIDISNTIGSDAGVSKHTNNDKPNQVLFGVTKSAKADTIRVNGETPTFKAFEANELMYTLWYIVGSDELYFDKVKITSD